MRQLLLIFALLLPNASQRVVAEDLSLPADTTLVLQQDTLLLSPDTMRVFSVDGTKDSFRFRPQQIIAPVTLITAGAMGLMDKGPIHYINKKGYEGMNKRGRQFEADEYLQYVPSGVHIVLGFIPGTHPQHNFRDRFIATATAHFLMAGVCNAVKYTVRERRPDSSKRNSFFSGHTATAFTGAELIRIEYGWGYGAAAYAVAATTGFLRVYNKRHWVGDVLAGAGVGILSADVGYWMLPVWKRLFRINERDEKRRIKKESKRTIVAAPFYLYDERAAGLSCSILL